jgi:predicted metalloprotease with PDZ domain
MNKLLIALILVTASGMTAKSQVKIGFEISFIEPQAHYAEVEMNISGLVKDYIEVKMPVWAPGSYLIREFSKSVEGFGATANGKAVPFQKVSKNTWRIHSAKANAIKIKYRVYAFEVSVRTSFIDDTHAFLSSTGIFMYPQGLLKTPSTVKIVPFKGWAKVSTGLEPVAGQEFTYRAADFDILFDSPIEVGNQDVFEFMASGVKHEVAMYGGGNYDTERLKVDMAKIVEQGTAIYGENPNKHYTFIVHNFFSGGGGLEHLNSTVLGAKRDAYNTEKGHKDFLELAAHEYYHLWNVKRMRPVALGPFDYDKENYTTNLWIAEGFTAYYENKLMLRAGFIDEKGFVDQLLTAISNVSNTPGNKVQTVAEASYDAWIKYYRPNENSNNTSVSYYAKGEVVGLLMDLEIAQATKGAKSLDDVMKAMYLQNLAQKKGYTDAEFKAMVEKISGKSFTDFWAKYINGTHVLEYDKCFGYIGVKVSNENEGKKIPYLGMATKKAGGKIFVSTVARSFSAWVGGLNANDELISIDGSPIEEALDKMPAITGKNVGDVVVFTIGRNGMLRNIPVTLQANPNLKLIGEMEEGATDLQKAVRKAVLY